MRRGACQACISLAVFLFICSFMVTGAWAVPGAREVGEGNELYKDGKFREATASYQKAAERNPSEAAIDYDLGASYYKEGVFEKAVESFQKSLLTDDDLLRRDVHFNLGNAFFKAGIAHENDDIGRAISRLESSISHYEKVIAADPKDPDAKGNLEFVKKELERLKQKQQNQQGQPDQQQSQQQKDQAQSSQSDQEKTSGQDKDQPSASGQENRSPEDKKDQAASQGQDQSSGQEKMNDVPQPQPGQGEEKDQGQPGEKNPDQATKEQGSSADQKTGDQEKSSQGMNSPEDKGKDQQRSSVSGQSGSGQVLSQEEARGILDEFDQNEQPNGLLNFIRKKRNEKPVEKDW